MYCKFRTLQQQFRATKTAATERRCAFHTVLHSAHFQCYKIRKSTAVWVVACFQTQHGAKNINLKMKK